MKVELSLLNKIRLFFAWLKSTGNYGLIECCEICNSIKIIKNQSDTTGRVYTAIYECKECGSKAKVREVWYKEA